MITWVVAGLGVTVFFIRTRDPDVKRRALLPISVAAGLVFLGGIVWTGGGEAALLALPVIAVIVLANIRLTKFCPRCGAWNYNYLWFARMDYCRRCGANLETGQPAPD